MVIELLISNGADTNRYRDLAAQAAEHVQHLFTHDLHVPVRFSQWDYRFDIPRVEASGLLAARSLERVEKSDCLLAIFGPSLPRVTSMEIARAFELRQAGRRIEFLLFANPTELIQDHWTFLDEIKTRFGEEIVFSEYRSELDFQSLILCSLVAMVFRRMERRTVSVAMPGGLQ